MGMVEVVYVPRRVADEARRRGLDLEELMLKTLSEALNLDPGVVVEARLELAERYLEEARQRLKEGDAVQAGEKMYRVVEECVKALSQLYDLPEYRRAAEEGRWWTRLLGKAARRLARMLNEPRIEFVWGMAYDIHVWGFHEAKYSVEDVSSDLEHVEWLLRYTREAIERRSKR